MYVYYSKKNTLKQFVFSNSDKKPSTMVSRTISALWKIYNYWNWNNNM